MTKCKRVRWIIPVAVLGGLAFGAVSADAVIVITPHPDLPGEAGAVYLSSETIDVTLSDRAAEVSVICTYHNPTNLVLEGTWLFPLPPEAAIDRFSLFVDGEEIEAELLDAREARRTYEGIVRRMEDPALLEYVDRQLLRARIYPIQPRSDQTIRLYYTHPLTADFGVTDFVFPLGSEKLTRQSEVSLSATIKTETPLISVSSPTHQVTVTQQDSRSASLTANPRWGSGISDFHLLCTYDTRDLGAQFLTMADDDGNGYFMAIIAPGETDAADLLPKDVVFCFDRSGSMEGEKIAQARAALHFCLSKLRPDDRFALLTFNSLVDEFSPSLRKATPSAIAEARTFVDRIEAEGGTNIDLALQTSMGKFKSDERPRYVVFLTDGRPTVGLTVPAKIIPRVHQANRHGARLFCFGVGEDLNAGLLNDLSEDGRGYATYVDPGDDVEISVSRFFRKVSNPVLANCSLVLEGNVRTYDIYPRVLPDVFAGAEIVVVGRFDGAGTMTARLLGQRGAERTNHTFEPKFTPQSGRYGFVPKLWAGRRIGHLLEAIRQNPGTGEVKDEIVRLSKKYGIMTPYTAFLAAPQEVMASRGMDSRVVRRNRVGMPTPTIGLDAVRVTRTRDRIREEQATTKRNVTAEKIKTMPTTDRAGVRRYATASDKNSDQSHVRGGRSEPQIYLPSDAAKEIEEARLKSSKTVAGMSSPVKPSDDPARIQSAGGRQFSLIDGVWTDWDLLSQAEAPADTIAIKRFSDAYFKLAQLKGMAPLLAIGDRVIFRFQSVVVRIDTIGEEIWNPDWNRLL